MLPSGQVSQYSDGVCVSCCNHGSMQSLPHSNSLTFAMELSLNANKTAQCHHAYGADLLAIGDSLMANVNELL